MRVGAEKEEEDGRSWESLIMALARLLSWTGMMVTPKRMDSPRRAPPA